MTWSSDRSDAGFSLVETLVAVFALALLMGAGSSMVLSSLRGQEELDSRHQRTAAIDRFNAHLRADLEQAVPRFVESRRSGEVPASFHGGEPRRDGTVLGLVRAGWSNFDFAEARSELLVVEYVFDEGRLMRRAVERPDRARRTPESEVELLSDLSDINVRFFAAGEPAEIWRSTFGSGQAEMPDAVEVVLRFSNDEVLTQRFLVGGRP
ncbi:MAG: type II secretion system minor pseudopilin GspJ [Pseudomonadota bacterium]